MLPLSLLKSATDYPVLIELKNGETYNGKLANIDLWMNVNMKQVIRTSKDGDQFWSVPEVYIRGNTIKYVRVPDVVLDAVAEDKRGAERNKNRPGRGRSRGRGGSSNDRGSTASAVGGRTYAHPPGDRDRDRKDRGGGRNRPGVGNR